MTTLTSATLPPLASRTIRMQTADFLRTSILQGKLRVGSRLVERRIAEELGTSLTAVREALVQLESEGLIVKKPNSTTHVVSLDATEIAQIFDVRAVLEVHAVEQAAALITPEQAGELHRLHDAAMQAARERRPQEYIDRDLHWHELVWRIPGNPYLYASIRRLVLPLFVYSALGIAEHDFNLVEDGESHVPILDALVYGGPEVARKVFLAALKQWRAEALALDHEKPAAGPNLTVARG